MKVLLINPPRDNEIRCPTPEVLENNRGSNPPLGLLYIAGVMENTGHEVEVIDCQVENLSYPEIEERIKNAQFDLLGVTVMTFSLIDSTNVSEIAKKFHPTKPIVWGGPHLHIYPKESAKLACVDYVITGEGEVSISHLVEFMADEREWQDVHGVGRFTQDGEYLYNGGSPIIENLDELPFVARHLTPYKRYSSILAKGDVVTTIFTSRGCPYKCAFCDRPQLRPNFRARSAENVVAELEHCLGMGINEFIIYDDTFTVSKQRVHEICDLIIEKKLKIYWDCRTSVNAMDEALLSKMAKAGCVGIHYGVEAGTEKIQKVIRKNLKLDKVQKIFSLTQKVGIKTMAYFIIGNPQETLEDIEQGFRFLRTVNPDFVHLTALLPFPATEIYLTGLSDGIIKYDYWKEFAENPDPDFVTPHWPEKFSRDEIDALIMKGYRSFYLSPAYIMRRLKQIRSISELKRNIRFGLGLLFSKIKKVSFSESKYFNFRNVRSQNLIITTDATES